MSEKQGHLLVVDDESVSDIIASAAHWHGSEHFTDDVSIVGLERKGE
jgi:hypothetical protein